jgi:hypothetical protein
MNPGFPVPDFSVDLFMSRWLLPAILFLSTAFAAQDDALPPTIALDGPALARLHRQPPAHSLHMLRGEADRRLNEPLVAVTDKKVAVPSGNPHDYVLFNLDGLFRLARLGEHVTVDLWHYRTDDGRSIRAALDWLLPYATGGKPWPYKQIGKPDIRPLVRLLRLAARVYHEPAYEQAIARLPDVGDELDWVNLLHPRF